MENQATSDAVERLEAHAADYLEAQIADMEKVTGAKVKEVEVAVVPGNIGEGPFVTVVVST